MKIIIATHHFPPHYIGGAEQYAYRLSKALMGRGHAVEVITIESVSEGGREPVVVVDNFDGVKTLRLSFDKRQFSDPFTTSYQNEFLGEWFHEYLQENRPDILHINSGYLLSFKVPEVSHELRIPTFITLHDYWILCPKINLLRSNGDICKGPVPESRCNWCIRSDHRRYRLFDRLTGNRAGEIVTNLGKNSFFASLLGLAPFNAKIANRREYLKKVFSNIDMVISPSKFLLGKVDQYGFIAKSRRYLPFGYAIQAVTPSSIKADHPKVRFGYLGQIASHKGIHTLVKAFTRSDILKEHAELYIYGKMEDADRYSQSLRKLAGNASTIRFSGPYQPKDIDSVMQNFDVLVVPSECFENRPTVITEAFSHLKPVVGSDLGGIPELVTHEKNGLLFSSGDWQLLAKQLTRFILDPSLLSKLKEGIEPVKQMDREIDELEFLYREQLLKGII